MLARLARLVRLARLDSLARLFLLNCIEVHTKYEIG